MNMKRNLSIAIAAVLGSSMAIAADNLTEAEKELAGKYIRDASTDCVTTSAHTTNTSLQGCDAEKALKDARLTDKDAVAGRADVDLKSNRDSMLTRDNVYAEKQMRDSDEATSDKEVIRNRDSEITRDDVVATEPDANTDPVIHVAPPQQHDDQFHEQGQTHAHTDNTPESELEGNVAKVYFGFDKSELTSSAKEKLDGLVSQVEEETNEPVTDLVIEGHTDSIGDAAYNEMLSAQRANAVKEYLNEKGINARYIQIEPKGESDPVAANSSPDQRAKNRRAEVKIGS